jgi:acetyltransferase-like isoleucine patch superfamily enzyme
MRSRPLLLECEDLVCGVNTRFGERVQIGAIGGPAQQVEIGDEVTIGDDVRILAPRVRIGDYSVIHHHTTIYGYDEVSIGPCSWIGQNAILNSSAALRVGPGCTISAYSTIWTHFSGGDPLQGCSFDKLKPCSIGEDVWIGVQCSVAPVDIGNRALLLAGSVLTKDVPANRVWGGNPASDLTAKLGAPYSEPDVTTKFSMLSQMLRKHMGSAGDSSEPGVLRAGNIAVTMVDCDPRGDSVFDVRDRSYSKLLTEHEIAFMHCLLPRIKFYPRISNSG